jgi:UDP-N-acetylmuramoyl-tripeptide--D-alanyl-D-alanine ligase
MKNQFKRVVTAVLTFEAKALLKRHKPRIIAITGSVGKTSTKDAIFTALTPFVHLRKSDKSFNSELGIPLTVLGLPNAWGNPLGWLANIIRGALTVLGRSSYPDWLILEVGADRPGDISRAMEWITPDVSVLTRLPDVPVHVEYFKSPEQVIEEKLELAKGLKPSGILVANQDDPAMRGLKERFSAARLVTYGEEGDADIFASHYEVLYEAGKPVGISFRVDIEGSSLPVRLSGAIGKQFMYPALAALAVASSLGFNALKSIEALAAHEPSRGRMRLLDGIKNTIIIDDTYNSSPVAVHEALKALHSLKIAGRKIAVLGDMLELGHYSVGEHKQVGQMAAKHADVLVTVGLRARGIAEGALSSGFPENNIHQFDTSKEAGSFLQNFIAEDDAVLVKGSQGIRTERVIEEIMANPDRKAELLVRQEEEWKVK